MVKKKDPLYQKYSLLIFHVFLSLVFILAETKYVFLSQAVTERLMSIKLGQALASFIPPELLIISSGICMVLAGIALILGYRTQKAALELIPIPITITVLAQGVHTLALSSKIKACLADSFIFPQMSVAHSINQKFKLQNV